MKLIQKIKHATPFVIATIGLLLIASIAVAQEDNRIQFSADVTTGVESVSPVLTWSTSPAANDCVASGSWAGSKGSSGTETQPTVTQDATYILTCTWDGVGSATLLWTPPTQNTDGTTLTDLVGYKLYWGNAPGDYPNSVRVDQPDIDTYIIAPLSTGTYYFVATAINANEIESRHSNMAVKAIESASGEESVGITVNARPEAPADLSIQ